MPGKFIALYDDAALLCALANHDEVFDASKISGWVHFDEPLFEALTFLRVRPRKADERIGWRGLNGTTLKRIRQWFVRVEGRDIGGLTLIRSRDGWCRVRPAKSGDMRADSPWLSVTRAAEEFRGADPATIARMIKATIEAEAKDDSLKAARLRRTQQGKVDRQDALRRRLALDFGAARGWTLSCFKFSVEALAAGQLFGKQEDWIPSAHPAVDHAYCYLRHRKAAAIAAHLYDWREHKSECRDMAKRYGLRLDVPDYPSWWYPGWTKLVVYIGPAGEGEPLKNAANAANFRGGKRISEPGGARPDLP